MSTETTPENATPVETPDLHPETSAGDKSMVDETPTTVTPTTAETATTTTTTSTTDTATTTPSAEVPVEAPKEPEKKDDAEEKVEEKQTTATEQVVEKVEPLVVVQKEPETENIAVKTEEPAKTTTPEAACVPEKKEEECKVPETPVEPPKAEVIPAPEEPKPVPQPEVITPAPEVLPVKEPEPSTEIKSLEIPPTKVEEPVHTIETPAEPKVTPVEPEVKPVEPAVTTVATPVEQPKPEATIVPNPTEAPQPTPLELPRSMAHIISAWSTSPPEEIEEKPVVKEEPALMQETPMPCSTTTTVAPEHVAAEKSTAAAPEPVAPVEPEIAPLKIEWVVPEALKPVTSLILWKQPIKTAGVLLLVQLIFYFFLWSKSSVLTMVCHFHLAILLAYAVHIYGNKFAVHYLGVSVDTKESLEPATINQKTLQELISPILAALDAILQYFIKVFYFEEPRQSFVAFIGLYLVSKVGKYFSGVTLAYLVILTLFVVPPLYMRYKAQIDKQVCIAHKLTSTHVRRVVAKAKGFVNSKKKKVE
ncbi:reticulon-3 [Pelomyxa schiedti]|nr:reticulon-3 [Pelomyxa schiedti]